MKRVVLDKAISLIKKNNPLLSDIDLERIRYGLEGIYLTFTKLMVIFAIALSLGLFKELLIFLFFYNIIRVFAFGLHASKSYICLITSSLVFILFPYIATIVSIPFINKLIISLLLLVLIALYAPADTHKRPLIKAKKRRMWKILSITVTVIYIALILLLDNDFITNIILFSLITETILILPITYKLFKLPYRNYLSYRQRGY